MIVCVCSKVSDREIAKHVHAGMSFDDIQLELGVATQCGCCEQCARDIVQQCSVSGAHAALHCAGAATGHPTATVSAIQIHR